MIFTLFAHFVGAFIRSTWWKWRGYEILASAEAQKNRQKTCWACPFRKEDECSVCRCLIASKTVLSAEKCPKNFWPREKVAKVKV